MADELEENYVLDSDGEYDDAEAGETVALEYDAQPTQGKRKRDDLSVETGAVTTGARRHDDPIDKPLTNTERNKRRRMAKKARKQERVRCTFLRPRQGPHIVLLLSLRSLFFSFPLR